MIYSKVMYQIISLLLTESPLELQMGIMTHWTKNMNVESPGVDTKIFKIHTADQHQHLLQCMQEWL